MELCHAHQFRQATNAVAGPPELAFVDAVNNGVRRVPAWPIYFLGAGHIIWLVWLAATGGLGVEPISALEQVLGETGLKMLIVGLMITPLRQFAGINLIRVRRAIGLTAFLYITAHLTVWLVLDLQSFGRIWEDILKRPFITIGMVGFTLMIPLAVTSNNWFVRRLGPMWRRLHKLVYLIALLGSVHFVMLRKGLQIEPLMFLAVVLILLAARIRLRKRPGRVAPGQGRA